MTPVAGEKIKAARALCEKGLWPDMLAFAAKWQAENPVDAKAWFYHGAALAATGRLVEAETSYRRALALDGTDVKAWNNLATVLFEGLNRPGEAAACLERALNLEPQNPLAWTNLASLNGQLGRHARALECAERALALEPTLVAAQLHRARAAQFLGRKDVLREASQILATLPPEQFRPAR